MGKPGATDAEVEQAARDCGCYDFIMGAGKRLRYSGRRRRRTSPAASGSVPLPAPC